MITLYQFNRLWGLPNASPFCMKVETYLRMANIAYEVRPLNNPQKSPKKKFPFIKDNGKVVADSEFIIAYLKEKYGDTLDDRLSNKHKALSVLIDNCFSERLYWIVLYLRWQYEPNWQLLKGDFFNALPAFLKLFVPTLVRRNMLTELYNQGTGRHSLQEVVVMGIRTIDALVEILGEQSYFLGDKPTSIDATAFAFMANMLWIRVNDPLKDYFMSKKLLVSYCNRMWDNYFSDFQKLPVPY